MFTIEDIRKQLEQFQIVQGHHIHVHSSLKAVGEVEGRGEALLSCVVEFFTEKGGMISFPTHTWDTNVLDLRRKDTCMGMLSKLALERTDGVRSLNPTHSMVLFGDGAKEYAKWDDEIVSSVSPDGCYGKLYDEDGYVLLMGVGQEKNTYIHAVEEALQIPNRITLERHNTTVVDHEGKKMARTMHLVFEEYGDISHYFGKLDKPFFYHNAITEGRIGNAKACLCNAVKMRKVLEMIHKNSGNIEVFLDEEPLPSKWYGEK